MSLLEPPASPGPFCDAARMPLEPASPDEHGSQSWTRADDPADPLSDWTLEVTDEDGAAASYAVHRVLVGAGERASLRLRREFQFPGSLTTRLELSAACAEAVPRVLDYLYTGALEPRATDLVPMLELAHVLMIPSLETRLLALTPSLVETHSALAVLAAAVAYQHPAVADHAGAVVARTLAERPPRAYRVLQPDTLKTLLTGSTASGDFVSHLVTAYLREAGAGDPQAVAELLAPLQHISSCDALPLLALAVDCGSGDAMRRCLDTVAAEFHSAFRGAEKLPSLPVPLLLELFARDDLHIESEDEVLEAVMRVLRARPAAEVDAEALARSVRFAFTSPRALDAAVDEELLPAELAFLAVRACSKRELEGDAAFRGWAEARPKALPFPTARRAGEYADATAAPGRGALQLLGAGRVDVTMSSVGSGNPQRLVDGGADVRSVNKRGSWVQVDVGAGAAVRPTGYLLQHCASFANSYMRSWRFEASEDGAAWTELDARAADETLDGPGAEGVFPCSPSSDRFWRYFRVKQTGVHSSGHHNVYLGRVEVYGYVRGFQ